MKDKNQYYIYLDEDNKASVVEISKSKEWGGKKYKSIDEAKMQADLINKKQQKL